MKKEYTCIEPEVAGEFGEGTIFIDRTARPPVVKRLNYEFFGWRGDDILTFVLCYIVTERFAAAIKSNGLTGVAFDKVEVTKSEAFMAFHPDLELPSFIWLKINGELGVDDFVIAANPPRLLIAERAFQVLSQFNINYATFKSYIDSVE